MSVLIERASAFAEIQMVLVASASELFAAYGMPIEYSLGGAVDSPSPGVMAVIGYAGRSARGALLILTSRAVVARLVPEELRRCDVPAELAMRDVLGEFANMLLGRVKNRLLARNMAPMLTTPTTVFGDGLQVPAPTSGMSAWHTFSGAAGELFVRFDATFQPDFALGDVHDGDQAPPAEGEMIAF